MTIGRNSTTAPSMIASVSLLDDASHTVRLALGSADDGSRKGNSASPAVAMVPAGTSAEDRKREPAAVRAAARRRQRRARAATGNQPQRRIARRLANQPAAPCAHAFQQRDWTGRHGAGMPVDAIAVEPRQPEPGQHEQQRKGQRGQGQRRARARACTAPSVLRFSQAAPCSTIMARLTSPTSSAKGLSSDQQRDRRNGSADRRRS